GELTVNGKIDGAGRGLDAIQDPNSIGNEYATILYDASFPQYPQTIGSTAGSAGIRYIQAQAWWQTFNGVRRIGQAAVARPALVVQDGALSGIPSELRGTPGIYGAPAIE